MKTRSELHALLSIGLEKDEPIAPTDRALISLAIPPEVADNPGIGWALGQISKIMNGEPRPKFKLPIGPIDPLNPFPPDTENSEFTQLYVTRGCEDIECVAEIVRVGDDIEIGNCFDLYGLWIHLDNEEKARALEGWIKWQEKQAHGADY